MGPFRWTLCDNGSSIITLDLSQIRSCKVAYCRKNFESTKFEYLCIIAIQSPLQICHNSKKDIFVVMSIEVRP